MMYNVETTRRQFRQERRLNEQQAHGLKTLRLQHNVRNTETRNCRWLSLPATSSPTAWCNCCSSHRVPLMSRCCFMSSRSGSTTNQHVIRSASGFVSHHWLASFRCFSLSTLGGCIHVRAALLLQRGVSVDHLDSTSEQLQWQEHGWCIRRRFGLAMAQQSQIVGARSAPPRGCSKR